MDQPSKLLATGATRGMKFIDLQDHIVHHILSYLSIEDLARLSIASTRCRELCRSVPSLMIDNKNRSERFSNFIDRFLGLRFKVGLEMQRFCLQWTIGSLAEKYRVETWLCYASNSNVQELDLEIIPRSRQVFSFAFALPLDVFRCKSLRSLKVNMYNCHLKLPALSSGFTALQSLRLKCVRIEQESFGEWVSSCCKSLKELFLQDLYGVNTISIMSSSLADLRMNFNSSNICHIKISASKLHTLKMNWLPISLSSKSLIITAPNLTFLAWEGYTSNYHYHVEKFVNLERAIIFLKPPQLNLMEHEAFAGLNLSEIVCSASKAKHLVLNGQFVELLFMQGCLPFALDDVRTLIINVDGLNGTLVPAIASLLKGTPALGLLLIMPLRANYNASLSNQVTNLSNSDEVEFDMEYWESQSLRFTNQLKRAAIKVCGGQNEFELLKYLLKHAKELKRMDVYCSLPLPSRSHRELTKLMNSSDKVRCVNKIHSDVRITYD